jgi:hypothetical protein
MPTVQQALNGLARELVLARSEGALAIKFIHGYGSLGVGGEIRIVAQKTLQEMFGRGELRAVIFGEQWSKSDDASWTLIKEYPQLKNDPDLGKRNQGITVVAL